MLNFSKTIISNIYDKEINKNVTIKKISQSFN